MAPPCSPTRLQFSGHETFPLRQLWLRKAYLAVCDAGEDPAAVKKVFTDASAIRRFGVGKNMVAAIRHWALACEVLVEGPGGIAQAGQIGDLLFGRNGTGPDGLDPYLEHAATAWLVHWLLASHATRSTTWYWLFNHLTAQTFDRNTIFQGLEAYAASKQVKVSGVTLRRDIEVCLRCYVSRFDTKEGDDAAEPLLADLGLLSESPGGALQFRRGPQQTLPDGIFAFSLLEFWRRRQAANGSEQNTLSFEAIAHEFGSPGRTFKLDENSVAERLMTLEEVTDGAIRWTDTAGVRQISRRAHALHDQALHYFIKKAYGRG